MLSLLGIEGEADIVGQKMLAFVAPEQRVRCANFLDAVIDKAPEATRMETLFVRLDGESLPVEMDAGYFVWSGEPAAQIVVRDITERKQAEEALRRERDMSQKYLDIVGVILVAWNEQGQITLLNQTGYRILGYKVGELEGKNWIETCVPAYAREEVRQVFQHLMAGRVEAVETYENPILTKSGEERVIAWHNTVLTNETGQIVGALASGEDVTERKRAEEHTRRQLQRLITLRNIDLAIAGSLNLDITLNVFVEQVTEQLNLDAVSVLLLDPHTRKLEFAVGKGFRGSAITGSRLGLGECYAGSAAAQRHIIRVPDLLEARKDLVRARKLEGEGFISYYAAPLIARGQVKGVVEIFHRAPLDAEPGWLEFLEALAAQMAIAIDNAELFDSLQCANAELSLAYDATLEGWSRALELRDKETKDHTRRVTEATLRLARAMGIGEAGLVHIRRGALLHDIGKMAIPDGILLKPGPLTDAEEEIMRKHPVYAYEMLSPIPYLRPALDIPCCHHERWDGTGYPHGLKGEQIPLAARIFAVVDVWDALRSDRPYRPGWPREKVCDYIRAQAGKHFDPQVVEAFLALEW
jgi:PAS domain S-box-containing protein/putative nucleotidyltransferase with HDIG domain